MTDSSNSGKSGTAAASPQSTEPLVKVIAFIATLGGLLFGYDTGVIAGALLFMKHDLHLTSLTTGMVTSFLILGSAIGAICAGHLADRFGRKKVILVMAVIFMCGSLGCAMAPNVVMMIIFRFILGLAVGSAAAIVPIYIAEIVPANRRWQFVTLQELMIVSGQLIAYTSNAAINEVWGGETTWRWMLGVACVPAVILWVGMLFLPDTPRWYAMHGRYREARDVLERTRQSRMVEKEMGEIRKSMDSKSQKHARRQKTISVWMKRLVALGIGIAMLQQLSGVNTIMFYAPTMLQATGLGTNASLLATIANGVISVVMTFVGIMMLSRFGRRPLLLVGQIGCTCTLLAIGLVTWLMPETVQGEPDVLRSYLVLAGMLIFLCFQQGALSPVTWLLLSEIFPMRIRGMANGISVFAMQMTNFSIAFMFPILLEAFGLTTCFFAFAAIGVAGGIFAIIFAPETQGKTLEQIEKHFKKHLQDEPAPQSGS
ncbi:sugar porter family MFS transporter [Erwinia pyri]|uniref:Sugar porter family MFS transporter n=1 Tax=Erwinia pyri TaxID=3062598 RepID=A0AA50HLG4_9GAMM|nr:sugar porter family MFS transporter [Erwinia sp. DE2]WLS78096.1 sugar porter family MFS transporter [Erwinia sp. DE2]